MARKKADDKQATDQTTSDGGGVENPSNVQADHESIAIGGITVGGDLTGTITIGHGYTAEQVSLLLTQITANYQRKPFDGRCPYRGLEIFKEEDAEFFFGREALVEDLVRRVQSSRTVFITGPSGSGKSSLIRAGLIPALKQGAIQKLQSERWLYETLKPGREPMGELARVASSITGTLNAGEDIRTKGLTDASILAQWCEIALKDDREKRVVLFVDQFEEVFTQVDREAERLAFLQSLTYAANSENGRVIVLFAMRSDFLPSCASYPELNALLNKQFIQIGAMRPHELVSAIAQPAMRVGLQIDPELIAQIVNDMQGAPGALPLMQFALKDLFDSQQANGGVIALTLNDYTERGGIYESLERHADASFARLKPNEQELARSIFSNLIEVGRGTQDARRTALFHELVPANANAEEVQAVVQKLADARLITTEEKDNNQYTITHEKLITAWTWLEKLINENRDVIALQNEITSDAKEWEDHQRDPSYLYTGARLANAREKTKELHLSQKAQAFLEASIDAQEGQRRAVERRRQWTMAGLIATALIMAALAFWGFSQALTAQHERDKALQKEQVARANELAAEAKALTGTHRSRSLLLGIEAYNKVDTYQTRDSLLTALTRYPQIKRYLFIPEGEFQLNMTAFSVDGELIAGAILESGESDLLIWRIESGEMIHRLHTDWNRLSAISFSDDGSRVAASTCSESNKTCRIAVWEIATGREINNLTVADILVTGNIGLNANGTLLAVASCAEYADPQGICVRGQVGLIDVNTGRPVDTSIDLGQSVPTSLSFVPEGENELFLTGCKDGESCDQRWGMYLNIKTGAQTTRPLPPEALSGSYKLTSISPKGFLLLTRQVDRADAGTQSNIPVLEMVVWDLLSQSQKAAYTVPLQDIEPEYFLEMDRDGDVVVINSYTHLTIVKLDQPEAKSTTISIAVFPDRVSTFKLDPSGKVFVATLGIASRSDIDPHGWSLIIGSTDENVFQQPLPGYAGQVFATAYHPSGKSFVTSTCESWERIEVSYRCKKGGILFWDSATLKPIGKFDSSSAIPFLEYSPDGKFLISVDAEGLITVWDAETYTPHVSSNQPVWDYSNIAVSPDGKILAVAANGFDAGDPIYFYDTEDLKRLDFGPALFEWDYPWFQIMSVAFSGSGKWMASVGSIGEIRVSNLEERKTLAALTNHESAVTVVFSPDGHLMISGGWDGTVMFWNLETLEPIGEVLRVVDYGHGITSLKFNQNGDYLFIESIDWNLKAYDATAREELTMAGVVTILDVKNRQRIGLPIPVSKIGMSINAQGTKLLTPGYLASLDIPSWLALACKVSGRNFTREEWAQYFPGEDYRATCAQWPVEPEPVDASSDLEATQVSTEDLTIHLININTASLEELESLPGIGPTTAAKIIDYRTENGPFTRIEDIVNVNGIGAGTLERIKDLITVSD